MYINTVHHRVIKGVYARVHIFYNTDVIPSRWYPPNRFVLCSRDHHKTSENYSGVDLKTAVTTFQLLDNRLKGTPEEGKVHYVQT